MSDVANQIADIKQKSARLASAQIRQVQGGYVVSCNAQYQDKVTKGVLLSENAEGVASTVEQAAQMAVNYVNTGEFSGTAPASV